MSQAGNGGTGTYGQQAGFDINREFFARVHDVQVAHGQLANAVQRRKGAFDFFYAYSIYKTLV